MHLLFLKKICQVKIGIENNLWTVLGFESIIFFFPLAYPWIKKKKANLADVSSDVTFK